MVLEILSNVLSFKCLFASAMGCLFGILLGCIPGLNGGIGITLLLPLSFTLEPSVALLLLGGVFMGSTYGGSISAILINVPGTSEAYCTSLEGYPMAKNKRGKEALYYAVLSSCFGGLVGVLVLIFFSPILAKFALKFGPPEYFLVGCVGLTVVGGLAGKSIFKGILAVALGLLLGMIGYDTITGGLRLTFGCNKLMMGVQLMPVILGIFAVSEMLMQLLIIKKNGTSKQNSDKDAISELGQIKVPTALKNVFKHTGLLIKSTLIGTFIGILPGPGTAISSFLAYSEAKRNPEGPKFGTGNPRGIIAAESANNAAVGGGFVPMMSLGIPGTPTAAIIYGAMIIFGLQPGPRLYQETPVIAYTFSYGMLVSVIIMGIAGLFLVPLFSKILKVDMKYIIVTVILCSLLGAYSIRNSMYDVFVTIIFGLLGVFLNKFKIPTSPIVLGIILSELIEKNFRLTLTLSSVTNDNAFIFMMKRPVCVGILIIGVLLVILNMRSSIQEKKIQKEINDGQ